MYRNIRSFFLVTTYETETPNSKATSKLRGVVVLPLHELALGNSHFEFRF